jgi:trimethylamine---corrinoid protein Co-methyltransferase
MIHNLLKALTDSEVARIHDESIAVLETVGLRVPHAKALEICRKAGAIVDEAAQTIKIPAAVMNELMNAALPKELPKDEPVTDLKGSISTQVFIVDYPGTTRRRGTIDDVRCGIFVSDTLKNIWGSSAAVIPGDKPFNETDIASFREIYLYSKKPGGTYILSPTSGRGIINMGRVMDRETGYLLETVSPLGFMTSSLEMALVFADEGMPLNLAPMVIGGATGPMTIWGNAVLENAELLGTNFVIHALTGRMGGYGAGNHTMDMRTTLCSFGSPNQALLGIAAAQMARHYGWYGGSNSALSDSCMPDYQCGFEKAFNGLFAVLSGCAGIGCQGIVGADQGVSLEQLVLDNEWLDAYNYVLSGIEPDDEALELIQKIGIGGNFLQEDHTMLNMRRNIWEAPAKTFWRDQWETWSNQGKKDIYTRAHEYVERVTAGYKDAEPVLEPSKAAEIERIYQETCAKLAKERE